MSGIHELSTWMLATLDEPALSRGVVVAMPLSAPDDTVSIYRRGSACVARVRHVFDRMAPAGSSMLYEVDSPCKYPWCADLATSQAKGLAMYRVKDIEKSEVTSSDYVAVLWLPHEARGGTATARLYLASSATADKSKVDALQKAYIRGKMRELGMPDVMSGPVTAEAVEALRRVYEALGGAGRGELPAIDSWQDAIAWCDMRPRSAMAAVRGALGPCAQPITLTLPKMRQYRAMVDAWDVDRTVVGTATRDELLSGAVRMEKYVEGFDNEAFLRLNPAIGAYTTRWWRLDKLRLAGNE